MKSYLFLTLLALFALTSLAMPVGRNQKSLDNKKYYDSEGNLLTPEQVEQMLAQGATATPIGEEVIGEELPTQPTTDTETTETTEGKTALDCDSDYVEEAPQEDANEEAAPDNTENVENAENVENDSGADVGGNTIPGLAVDFNIEVEFKQGN